MRILMLGHYFLPKFGGVEKVMSVLCDYIDNHEINIITEKHDANLPDVSHYNKWTKIYRFKYPHKKYYGLIQIWVWLFNNRSLISESQIIHIHDVFIWYLPFCLLYPRKSVYITFHGWEGIYPIPIKSLFQKKLGSIFCKKSIAVGKYLEKYNNIKVDLITYNGVEVPQKTSLKKKNSVVYVGRLEKNTGLEIMLQAFELLPNCKVDFYGDGELRDECKKFGVVHGFVNNPEKFVAKAHFCLAGGYLACFEAFANKAQVFVCYQNQLRRDTFLFTPFRKYITLTSSPVELANKLQYYMKHNYQSKKITNEAYAWVKRYSWSKVINQYKRIWELSE